MSIFTKISFFSLIYCYYLFQVTVPNLLKSCTLKAKSKIVFRASTVAFYSNNFMHCNVDRKHENFMMIVSTICELTESFTLKFDLLVLLPEA